MATRSAISRRTALGSLSAIGLTHACKGLANSIPNSTRLTDFIQAGDVDHGAALSRAIAAGNGSVHIPDGVFIIDHVSGSDVHFYGEGTLRKKPGTKGVMLYLSGTNRIEGITLDYDWPRAEQSMPFVNNITVYQRRGALHLANITCRRSFYAAVYIESASLDTNAGCRFIEAIPHNGRRGPAARLSHYIVCVSDERTRDESIVISGGEFVGASLEKERLHLNPTGVFITPSKLDGNRFRSVRISDAAFTGCSTNCGEGNVTGAIDIYNGAENITISRLTIRLFTYAAIKVQNSSQFFIVENSASEGHVPSDAFIKQSCGCLTTQRVRGSMRHQSGGRIYGNHFSGMTYAAIINDVDSVDILDNVIDGVTLNKLGNAIENAGNDVRIIENIGRDIEGYQINSSGDRCVIESNVMDSGTVGALGGVTFSGVDVSVNRNRLRSGRRSGGSGIRTNGPASNFNIAGNVLENFPYGVDIRATAGTVRDGKISANEMIGNGTPVNVASDTVHVQQSL